LSNYTKSTNFATKDNLSPGDPLKIVRGTEIDTEFNNISTAISTKTDNSAAAITGGSITGITDLAVADGGTGASTATAALNNLLPSQSGNSSKYLQTDGTNATWDAISINTGDITGTLPVANGGTGITSFGTGIATFLGTPSSANLASAVTDETGSGALVFANTPTLVAPILGTPTSGNFSSGSFTWPTFNQNTTGTAAGLSATLAIASGGTGQTTANAAFNALAPSQTSASGKYLKSDGTNTSWDALDISTADITGTLPVANGGTGVTSSTGTGNVVLSNSPTLVTPILGTPQSGNFSTGTFTWPTFNQNTTGTAAGLSATLATTSGGTGLTSFTSGGVVYASSSSALATGSALTFDGTNLGVGGTSSGKLTVFGGELIWGASSALGFLGYTGGFPLIGSVGALPLAFYTNSAERVRIDSSGRLLQGTTSPNAYVSNATNAEWSTVFSKSNSSTSYDSVIGQVAIDNLDTTANNYSQLAFTTSDGGNRVVTAGIYAQITARSSSAWTTSNLQFHTGTVGDPPTEKMRIASTGVVGVGITPSPWVSSVGLMDFRNSGGISSDGNYTYFSNNIYYDGAEKRKSSGYVGLFSIGKTGTPFIWSYAGTGAADSTVSFSEAMRIDGSGNLLVGTTTSPSGAGNIALGSNVLRPNTGYLLIEPKYPSPTAGYYFYDTTSGFFSLPDNTNPLGNASYRWTTVYATTALINTSDVNTKQQIRSLNDAEKAVAQSIKGLIKAYKFNDSVAEKGDGARIHVGVIAQDVQAAFTAQGLDSNKYSMFCSDTWYEVDGKARSEEDGFYTKDTPNAVEVTRLGIRYDELLAFVISTL
jgi:hypothetical protein